MLNYNIITSLSVLCLWVTYSESQREFFRTELFPEQLEQQQLQIRQRLIQDQIQLNAQRLQQARNLEEQQTILRERDELLQQSQEMQLQQQILQQRLQEKLNGVNSFVPSQASQQNFQQSEQRPVPVVQTTSEPQILPEHTDRVVFPEDTASRSGEIDPPCSTQSGVAGLCKPLVKCITFYAELPELRRQPCRLQNNELGVCCPLNKRQSAIPSGLEKNNNGVLNIPPPPPVVIPALTPQNLNNAALVALDELRKRLEFVASLFANNVVVQSGTPAASHQEFFPTTNETLKEGEKGQKNVDASINLVSEFQLSADQGRFALPTFSVLNTIIADTCPQPNVCRPSKYRSADGSCNNLSKERWGKTGTALQRILPPKYGDGVNSPRVTAADGNNLPSARFVSSQFAQDANNPYTNLTLLVMQWGQFLDHDLTHTPISRGQGGSGLSCCNDGDVIQESLRHPDCFPIEIPQGDKIFSRFREHCMEFVRSLPAPRPECNFGPREQMNQITGFLDGSNIYGSNLNKQRELREFRGGLLKVQNIKGRSMLPENRNECTDDDDIEACFRAGDGRVNEQVNLAVMHTVWMREHNRIANILSRVNPCWSDEDLFQEARRIVVAEMQHITYNEFLPIILGRDYLDKFELTPAENGFTQLYDSKLNPGITNVFATAAFRFGHTLIQSSLEGYGRFGNVRENLILHKQHFSPFVLYKDGALDDFIRGLSTQTCQRFDRFFSKEITDKLFQGDLDFGLDLVALNIQRGRDHGLAPYNDWREVCGLPRASSWDSLLDVMDPQSVNILQNIYGSVDEVDLFVAGVAEKPLPGAILGQTFVCLVGDQFARLRRGDRFFYEEENQLSSFNEEQLKQLRKASLARVLCDNSDDIAVMQPLAFFQVSLVNQRIDCQSPAIPHVDLKAWRGEPATNQC